MQTPERPAKRLLLEYLTYLRLTAFVFGLLFTLAAITSALRNPLPTLIQRAPITLALFLVGAVVTAAIPVIVPRLWFWPWMRKR
jgi:hypothetical protein